MIKIIELDEDNLARGARVGKRIKITQCGISCPQTSL
jgi:hypothetical protein